MVSLDDKMFYKAREIIQKFPRLQWMLPHLPIYMGAGMILFGFTLFKTLDPLPDYDKPVITEAKKSTFLSSQR